MKVKRAHLASVLKLTPAAITMAVDRGKLNTSTDGSIDTQDRINHAWITKRLLKQGCEIPQDISTLFKATPLTEDGKSNGKNNGKDKQNQSALPDLGPEARPDPDGIEGELKGAAREISATQRLKEKSQAEESAAKADIAKTKAALMRRELIKINPFARLLSNVRAAERSQLINAIPNISQTILDDIKSALNAEKPDTVILMELQDNWKVELAKIFDASDKELKAKIRQAKDKLVVDDDDEYDDMEISEEVAQSVA